MGEIILTIIIVIITIIKLIIKIKNSRLYETLAGASIVQGLHLPYLRGPQVPQEVGTTKEPTLQMKRPGPKENDFTSKLKCCWYVKARADCLIRKSDETQYAEARRNVPLYTEVRGSHDQHSSPGCHPAFHPRRCAGCNISGSNFPAAGTYARFSQTTSGLCGWNSIEGPS